MDTNQLAPSAARPLLCPFTTGASTAEIHLDSFQADASNASVRFPTSVAFISPLFEKSENHYRDKIRKTMKIHFHTYMYFLVLKD